ncbi:MAG: hypothetical protein N2662_01630 [Bacteroidales bacterium]|nr:hypothetical protein [Bacteroidales bacterium]
MNDFLRKLDTIAHYISVIFNPLIIPTLGTVMLFFSGYYFGLWPKSSVIWIIFIVSLGTLLIPLFILMLLKTTGHISDYQLSNRSGRILPYTLILVNYFLLYLILQRLVLPEAVNNIVLSAGLCILANIIILFYWKISTHAIGVGGLMAITFLLYTRWQAINLNWLIFSIIISGLVCSARLWLKVHTERQVYAGFLLGFLITFIVLILG